MHDAIVDERQLVLVASVLALMALAHLILRWWIRRKARQVQQPPADATPDTRRLRRWLTRGLTEILPPLALLIWIHGLYLLASLLLRHATGYGWMAPTLIALDWLYGLSVVVALFWLLSRIGGLIDAFLLSLAAHTKSTWDDVLLPLAGQAVRRGLPLLALILGAPALAASPGLAEVLRKATSLMLIALVAFLLVQIVDAAAAFVLAQHRIDIKDKLQARAIHTQVLVLKKVTLTAIGVFTLASMLMVFESVRQFGASILASAGIAWHHRRLRGTAQHRHAARRFQLALTQPIRVDDVVIVENEWGRIEDITLTYVVVRIWDERRLIVPMSYFIEQPFQNWTRSSSELLGTVFLHVDYSVPLETLREELTRILRASPYWDGRVNVLQVTDAKEHTLEVRALASAADASLAWDLRCEVREQLISFVRRRYPASLPHLRTTFEQRGVAAEFSAEGQRTYDS